MERTITSHTSITTRLFVVGPDDVLYRLSVETYVEMLSTPSKHRFPLFAGERAKSAELDLELVNRRPTRVLRSAFLIMPFDSHGHFDSKAHAEYMAARLRGSNRSKGWTTAGEVLLAIYNAALGRGSYRYMRSQADQT